MKLGRIGYLVGIQDWCVACPWVVSQDVKEKAEMEAE